MKTKTTAQFLPQVCTELQTIIIMRLLTVSRLIYYSSTPQVEGKFQSQNPKRYLGHRNMHRNNNNLSNAKKFGVHLLRGSSISSS